MNLTALLHTAQAAQAEIEAKLADAGLSLPKLLALQVLADGGESMPLSQLADRLSCVRSNVTQLVDRLEADGFVERQFDPNDRRSRLAVLTTAGRQSCREGSRIKAEAEADLLAALSAEEAEQLGQLLGKVGRR